MTRFSGETPTRWAALNPVHTCGMAAITSTPSNSTGHF